MRLIPTSITQNWVDPANPTGGLTLDALMARQKQLIASKPEIPTQIASPWQGASLMANSFVNSLGQMKTQAQETAGRQKLAQAMQQRDPTTGELTPDAETTMMTLDPEHGMQFIAQAMQSKREQQMMLKKQELENAAAQIYKPGDVTSMRNDVISDPAYKNLSQAVPMWKGIQDAASRDTPQADLNMIIGLAKLYDPTSVVRHGETEDVQKTAGLPASIFSAYQFLIGAPGSRLTADVRKGVLQEGYSRVKGYQDAYKTVGDAYTAIAGRHNVNASDVVPQLETFTDPLQQGSPADIAIAHGKAREAIKNGKSVADVNKMLTDNHYPPLTADDIANSAPQLPQGGQ